MPQDKGSQRRLDWTRLRMALIGPQLAAFIPAIMLGAYWFGGEGVLLTSAVIVPALVAFVGFVNQPPTRREAGRDPVLGLPDRDRLLRALEPEHGRKSRGDDCIALVVEIDHASGLAEQYGVDGIETILRACGRQLGGVLRENDLIAALGMGRFGFAIGKTPRVDLEAMVQLAGRLQDALSAPVPLGATHVRVSACIGFALPSRVAQASGEAMLHAAESALHEAQQAGPGSIRAFTKTMRPRVAAPDNVTKDVVTALETGQIVPWFQPQISTDTGEITGIEALARWIHPDKGMIAPGAFLPAIARAGLFERLGEVILFHALTSIRAWDKAGLKVPNVAVNVSPEELRNPRLFDKIRWELDRFEIAPERLTIEILEDVVAQSDDDTTTRNIAALSNLGCRIDLDDFGTGHASIANIRRFDLHRIKIDRSYIAQVDTDREQQSMIAAILTMAERLGLDTLGEGVESHGEHAMLAQLGCGHVQGYSIAKPMPFKEIGPWIEAHQKKIAHPPVIPRKTG
jgi:diguanylate cyclase (GGDEF)-like protein